MKTFSLDRQGLGISLPNFLDMIPKVMEATRLLRVRLEKIADDTIGNVEEKRRLYDNIRSQTKRLNYAADRCGRKLATGQARRAGGPAKGGIAGGGRPIGMWPPTRWRPRGPPLGMRSGVPGPSIGRWSSPRSS